MINNLVVLLNNARIVVLLNLCLAQRDPQLQEDKNYLYSYNFNHFFSQKTSMYVIGTSRVNLYNGRNFAHLILCFAARPTTSRGQKLLITGQFDFSSSNLMHVSQKLKMANDLISFFRVDLYARIYAHLRTRGQTLLKIVQFFFFKFNACFKKTNSFFKFNACFTKTNSYDFRQLEVLSR